MPYFTSVTRSGAKATLESGSHIVTLDGVPMPLPDSAGPGLDLVAADVGSDVWAVCIGAGDDCGYLLKLNERSITKLGTGKVRGRYAVWVAETGDVSWVPNSDPYAVEHLDGTRSESRDTHHPLSPNEILIETWGPVRVVQIIRSGRWAVGEDVAAPSGQTRIFASDNGGYPRLVWAGYAPLPAQVAAHLDGSCTVAVQIPRDVDAPVFVHSSQFSDIEVTPTDPIPPPPTPEPEPEPMPQPPDHSHIVRQVNDAFPHLLETNTRDTCREFLWRCVVALHEADKRWGFLSKTEAENHVTIPGVGRVAIDAITYRDWDGAVDIIANNSNPPEPGRPFWDVVGKRPSSVWVQPVPFPGGGEPPSPPDDPPSDRHKYQGGGNDTGVCDQCGQVRSAVIHVIPESSRPHTYDGGEQDTGLCDICQRPKADGIHQGIADPPPPPPPPPGDDPTAPSERELIDAIKANTESVERMRVVLVELTRVVQSMPGAQTAPAPDYVGSVRVLGPVRLKPEWPKQPE